MCNFIHKLCFFFFRVIVDVDEGALLVIGFGGVGNGGGRSYFSPLPSPAISPPTWKFGGGTEGRTPSGMRG